MEYILAILSASLGATVMWAWKHKTDCDRLNHFKDGSQAYVVRMHLEQGKKLSKEYAYKHYNIKKLSAVIDVLRKAGVEVKSVVTDDGHYYTL